MKRLVALLLLLNTACAGSLPRTVEVPVAVPCPAPPQIHRPRLAIGSLTPDTPPAEVVRAYVSTIEALGGYATQLETILDGYRGGAQ